MSGRGEEGVSLGHRSSDESLYYITVSRLYKLFKYLPNTYVVSFCNLINNCIPYNIIFLILNGFN